jgi:hypothetical protein
LHAYSMTVKYDYTRRIEETKMGSVGKRKYAIKA